MSNKNKPSSEPQKVETMLVALDNFISTMDKLAKTQQQLINKTNRQLELTKIETIKKQIQEQ